MQYTQAWGSLGNAKFNSMDFDGVIATLSDYRSRDDVEAWMLCNLALAYLNTPQIKRAEQVALDALALPTDQSHTALLSLSAMFAASRKNDERALAMLQACSDNEEEYFGASHYCFTLASGLLGARGSIPDEPKSWAELGALLSTAKLWIYLPIGNQHLARYAYQLAWAQAPYRPFVFIRAYSLYVVPVLLEARFDYFVDVSDPRTDED